MWILLQFNKYASILISPTLAFCGTAVTKWKQQMILRKKNWAAMGLSTFLKTLGTAVYNKYVVVQAGI